MPGASALRWKICFLSTFGKKIQQISGEDPFFLAFSYIWLDIKAAKYNSAGAPRRSVDRGGGVLAGEVCKIARFWCFWGRFLVKNWKQPPPIGNWVPKLWSTCRDTAWKSVWISDYGRKISLNFGEDLVLETTCFWAEKTFEPPISEVQTFFCFFFFKISLNFGEDLFLETNCFLAEKTFQFLRFPRNSLSILGQTVWFWFKNNANLGLGRLHFSHSFKKASPFSKSWLRTWLRAM